MTQISAASKTSQMSVLVVLIIYINPTPVEFQIVIYNMDKREILLLLLLLLLLFGKSFLSIIWIEKTFQNNQMVYVGNIIILIAWPYC